MLCVTKSNGLIQGLFFFFFLGDVATLAIVHERNYSNLVTRKRGKLEKLTKNLAFGRTLYVKNLHYLCQTKYYLKVLNVIFFLPYHYLFKNMQIFNRYKFNCIFFICIKSFIYI